MRMIAARESTLHSKMFNTNGRTFLNHISQHTDFIELYSTIYYYIYTVINWF